ncbi:MAG: AbrB/MazE/SpoVT family DNA-binding domain-containing protein, partial [Rubrivivax sp.]
QVAKWGNSLAVRFPASLVQALNLKEGEEIELHLLGERSLAVARKDTPEQMLERLRALRGRLPADFHFDRQDAQAR